MEIAVLNKGGQETGRKVVLEAHRNYSQEEQYPGDNKIL